MRMARNRPIAWLAIVLVALNALWPLVAQARPKSHGILVPLCTIDGVTHYTELPAPKAPAEQRSEANHEHCKICLFGLERAFLPTVTAQVDTRSGAGISRWFTARFPRDRSFDSLARPRAPPVFS
jgi:hypothetical protein